MNEETNQLLREIRDDQREAARISRESLQLSHESMELSRSVAAASRRLMRVATGFMFVVLIPLIGFLILLLYTIYAEF